MAALQGKATNAVIHWLRFPAITPPQDIDLSTNPDGALSWKFGPDGLVAPDGNRFPSATWCGVSLHDSLPSAERAFDGRGRFMPFLPVTVESWHALLHPVAHHGSCNHLERGQPGPLFQLSGMDPGGPLLVMTTAGFVIGPQLDMRRVHAFRVGVDSVRASLVDADGIVAYQVFTPHSTGDDGATMTVWRSDAQMVNAMYRPGLHRSLLDDYHKAPTADRTSFTRFRFLRTAGQWAGRDPAVEAHALPA
jgi:hypothetical protein